MDASTSRKIDSLVENFNNNSLSRREFIKRGVQLGFSASLLSGLITSFPKNSIGAEVSGELLEKIKDEGDKLNILSWSNYIDPDIIPNFEEKYGINVTLDTAGGNSEILAKIQAGGGGYDIAVPTQQYSVIMRNMNLLQELNKEWIPNYENINPKFVDTNYDPGGKYTVPYQWGTNIYGFNSKYVKDIPFTDSMWLPQMGPVFRKEYSGRIAALNEFPETVQMVNGFLGHSINVKDEKPLLETKEIMVAQKPWMKGYLPGAAILKQLINGSIWIGENWNGKVVRAVKENPDVKPLIPREKFIVWVDVMVLTNKAPHPAAAHLFMNYLLEPEVGAKLSNFNRYPTPNKAAMDYINPEDRDNPIIYPPEERLNRAEFSLPISGKPLDRYENIWEAVVG